MISTKGRYALRLMIDIAQQGEGVRTSLREVSERQQISIKYLEQLVSPLVAAGLLTSVRGPHGGYSLSRPADAISVVEIVSVAEGGLEPVACLADEETICPRREECTTIDFWTGLNNVIHDYMGGVTLAELASKPNEEAAFHG